MDETQYICVGICMSDPDSGHCLGCGRPPLETVVVEVVAPTPVEQKSTDADPDSPE